MENMGFVSSQNKRDLSIKKKIQTGPEIFQHYRDLDTRTKMEDFGDIYSEEEIKEDRRRVEYVKLSKDYEKPTVHGKVFENLFCEIAEKFKWFGEGARIVQLTEYDDIIASGAHCDAVLEIPMGDNLLRIGLDLTTAVDFDNLLKKRTKCIDAVEKGKNFPVKYFQSKIDQTRGKIENIPVFFVGIDKEALARLCDSVAKQKNSQDDLLENNEVQFMILDELYSQALVYRAHAEKKHGKDSTVTKKMEHYGKIFKGLIDTKKSLRSKDFEAKASADGVYNYIKKYI
jgi:hypothetical protein